MRSCPSRHHSRRRRRYRLADAPPTRRRHESLARARRDQADPLLWRTVALRARAVLADCRCAWSECAQRCAAWRYLPRILNPRQPPQALLAARLAYTTHVLVAGPATRIVALGPRAS